ncbi:MAG: ParB/RepB/Spo0J family partition protein [Chloroflexi bacterium]|nr:ParB/RepB/Spo0J family partition protein [Chloroflexota bacterium]
MARKPGLGKGLGALIPEEKPEIQEGTLWVPIEKIILNPQQPRFKLNPDELQELADSIREHGIIQPLIVTQEPEMDRYILIAGERRLKAAGLADMETVPVILRQATEQQRLELALIENIQRADLTPLETATAYQHLNETFNLSHEEIAKRVGKNRVTVTNNLRLLKLAEPVRNALAEGTISEGHARALLGLNSPEAQTAALQTVTKQDLNVRQTEELVRKLTGTRPAPRQLKQPDPEIKALEEKLRDRLGTRVNLNNGKKGGSLVIYYYSAEELESIVNQIIKEE